jgi:hypothetical protein
MAQQILTHYIDDLDGTAADGPVKFGLDGRDYEIDLSDGNAQRLRDALAPYVGAARKGGKAAKSTTAPQRRPDTALIREWCREQGLQVKDRGRIPEEYVIRYNNRDAA